MPSTTSMTRLRCAWEHHPRNQWTRSLAKAVTILTPSLNRSFQSGGRVPVQRFRGHLDLLAIPSMQHEPVDHRLAFLCQNMVPMQSTRTPFRNVYPALALAGLMSSSAQSSAEMAVLHGICTSAAFSLNRLKQGDDRYLNLALKARYGCSCRSSQVYHGRGHHRSPITFRVCVYNIRYLL